jgi:glycosyltransferase involved in cell wall biosynthesis
VPVAESWANQGRQINMTRSFCIVGPQPPPRHGMSAVNEAVAELARESGAEAKCFNTSPITSKRTLQVRLARLWPVARAFAGVRAALRDRLIDVVYCSVSGGFGILGEMPIVWIARRHDAQVVLHHHNFTYLDRPFAPMNWLARLAGPNAVHVVLGENMERALCNRYSQVKQTLVVSNAAFIKQSSTSTGESRVGCRVIGHLSNLCLEKGLYEVVELAQWAQREKLDFEFRVAGPFENKVVQSEFDARTRDLNNLHYLGPLYGEEKVKFFQELDAFVFPTQYRNEAEPLVLLEALSQKCPVISYERGCISSIIDPSCGALVPREGAFLAIASATLRNWQNDPEAQRIRRRAALQKFNNLLAEANTAKQKLLSILCGGNFTTATVGDTGRATDLLETASE